jgi:hypothetical protein
LISYLKSFFLIKFYFPIKIIFRKIFYPQIINALVGGRMNSYFQAYKKEISKKKYSDFNNFSQYKKDRNFLLEAFCMYGVRINYVDSNWWNNCLILSLTNEKNKCDQIKRSLIKNIDKSKIEILEYWEMLNISSFLISIGLIDLGYELYKKAIKKALNYPSKLERYNTWKLKAKLSALIETGEYVKFDELFAILKRRLKKNSLSINTNIKKLWQKEHFQLNFLKKKYECY